MSPAELADLAEQASFPEGIAARIDSTDLARLLEERSRLVAALDELLNGEKIWEVGAAAARDALAFAREGRS